MNKIHYVRYITDRIQEIMSTDTAKCPVSYMRKYTSDRAGNRAGVTGEDIERFRSQVLTRKYFDYETVKVLRCFFNIFAIGGVALPKYEGGVDYHSNSEDKIDRLLRPKVESIQSAMIDGPSVYTADVLGESNLFILKVSPNPYSMLFEYFIGAYGTNTLRKTIPNFALVVSIFSCGYTGEKVLTQQLLKAICAPVGRYFPGSRVTGKTNYVVYERVIGETFLRYLQSGGCESDMVVCYIQQLLFALQFAYDKIRFNHRNLHPDNIILKDLESGRGGIFGFLGFGPRKKEKRSLLYGNTLYTFTTDRIPVIIDYGTSSMHHDGLIYQDNHSKPIYAFNAFLTFPGHDMYRLIMNVLYQLAVTSDYSRKIYSEVSWIAEFYRGTDPYGVVGVTPEQFARSGIAEIFFYLDRTNPAHLPALRKSPLELFNYIQGWKQDETGFEELRWKNGGNYVTTTTNPLVKYDTLFDKVSSRISYEITLMGKQPVIKDNLDHHHLLKCVNSSGELKLLPSQESYLVSQLNKITTLALGGFNPSREIRPPTNLIPDIEVIEAINAVYNNENTASHIERLSDLVHDMGVYGNDVLGSFIMGPDFDGDLDELEELRPLSFIKDLRHITNYDNHLKFIDFTGVDPVQKRRFGEVYSTFNKTKNILNTAIQPLVIALHTMIIDFGCWFKNEILTYGEAQAILLNIDRKQIESLVEAVKNNYS